MRISDITQEPLLEMGPTPPTPPTGPGNANGPKQMQVVKDDPKATTVVDPKTKVTMNIPKDPKKPGAASTDKQGNVTINTKASGPGAQQGLKAGTKVNVI
jgi:hypothetical protein